ncbi:MAG: hypothetical protein I3274_02700 [Candidatus Moeniiplasma glomeromycotorum]|nr:hypothetical protein [Candidatus Moeniiplasma glomeromycotorum]MCE8167514.1 hypothetical protein [Candidatus Moeniiplasma glomeromycotorum]
MLNNVNYNDFNHFTNLRGSRPYLYIHYGEWLIIFSITSQEKARFPHKFKLELECDCLDSEKYESSFVSLNTKILVSRVRLPIIAKKYGISLDTSHTCLKPVQLKELLEAINQYWNCGKRKLITIILNS